MQQMIDTISMVLFLYIYHMRGGNVYIAQSDFDRSVTRTSRSAIIYLVKYETVNILFSFNAHMFFDTFCLYFILLLNRYGFICV